MSKYHRGWGQPSALLNVKSVVALILQLVRKVLKLHVMPVATAAKFHNHILVRLLQQFCPPVCPVARLSMYSQLVGMHTQIKVCSAGHRNMLGMVNAAGLPTQKPHLPCKVPGSWETRDEAPGTLALISFLSWLFWALLRDRVLHLADLFPPSM